MNEEEEDYINECGRCPNCGANVHISEMGKEDGVVYCCHCYNER